MIKQLFFFVLLLAAIPATAQLINPGFEDTTAGPVSDTSTTINRGGWYMEKGSSRVTSDSYSGNYALSIWNWYTYVPGQLSNSETTGNGTAMGIGDGGKPMTQKPSQLTGYYKFIPGDNGGFDNDSAVALVLARRWNSILNRRDTVAFGVIKLKQTSVYIPFAFNINDRMPGTDPDSVLIGFWSCNRYEGGNCNCTGASGGHCLYLTVDELSMTTPTGITSLSNWFNDISVFPNPSSSDLTIDLSKLTSSSSIVMYDALGRQVANYTDVTPSKKIISRGALPSGTYFLCVFNDEKAIYRTTVVLQ